jgi:hypothetical protein
MGNETYFTGSILDMRKVETLIKNKFPNVRLYHVSEFKPASSQRNEAIKLLDKELEEIRKDIKGIKWGFGVKAILIQALKNYNALTIEKARILVGKGANDA